MGARVARMFRNFNLENRVNRELSREKPIAAPRHEVTRPPVSESAEVTESLSQKNDPLLNLLRSVYVESKDPAAAPETPKEVTTGSQTERRPLRYNFSGFGLAELSDVPKGKLTIVEALKALSSHQQKPQTWTAETIAQEYSLDLKDAKALVQFFVPFKVEIIPPKTRTAKQIKAS